MKHCIVFLFALIIVSNTNGKEMTYAGSTPADAVIRLFLGLPLGDSIDFIRWKLVLQNNQYMLDCNYGISKPNTNGFINGGDKIKVTDKWRMEQNNYLLQNGNKMLKLAKLNDFLMHILNTDNSLLVGNGGWSYTLNYIKPQPSKQLNIAAQPAMLKDSVAFQGRTPCAVPGVIAAGRLCYKLKWYLVLYAHPKKNFPTTYRMYGTPDRKAGGRKGTWEIRREANGRTIYQLNDDDKKGLLYLLKLDENILVFTDAHGNLLVGDEDFSYTLNHTTHVIP